MTSGSSYPLSSVVVIWTLLWLQEVHLTCAGTQTFELASLCKAKSPTASQIHREIDGAVIIARNDKNLDCAVTFTAEYVTQRFMIRFDEFQVECGDQVLIYDSATIVGNPRAELNCRYFRPEDIGVIRTRGHTVTLKFLTDNWGTNSPRFTMIITAYKDSSQGCRDSFHCGSDNVCISNRLQCDSVYNCVDRGDESRAANCSSNFLLDLMSLAGTTDSNLGMLMIGGLLVMSTITVLLCVCYCQKRSSQPRPPSQPPQLNNRLKSEVRGGQNGSSITEVAMTTKTDLNPNHSSTFDSLVVSKSGNLRLPAAASYHGYMKRLLHHLQCSMGN